MDEFDEKDALWRLLGRVPPAQASPYFSRKVLRAVREEPRPAFSISTLFRWLAPASVLAAVVVGWAAFQWQQEQSLAQFNEYFDQAADLDSLVAYENMSAWENFDN